MQEKEDFLNQSGVCFVSQHSRSRPEYMKWRKGFGEVLKKVDFGGLEGQEAFNLLVHQFERLMPFVGEHSGLIFSDENILGWPLGHYYGRYQASRRVGSFYPSLRVVLEAFATVLSRKFDVVSFYLVKRNWLEQVKSLYKDFFRKYYHEGCIPFEDFLASLECHQAQQSFDRFWEEAASFPNARLISYSSSSGEVLLKFLDEGLGLPLMQYSGGMPRSNSSLDDGLVEKMIALYPYLRLGRSRYSDREFNFLRKLLS